MLGLRGSSWLAMAPPVHKLRGKLQWWPQLPSPSRGRRKKSSTTSPPFHYPGWMMERKDLPPQTGQWELPSKAPWLYPQKMPDKMLSFIPISVNHRSTSASKGVPLTEPLWKFNTAVNEIHGPTCFLSVRPPHDSEDLPNVISGHVSVVFCGFTNRKLRTCSGSNWLVSNPQIKRTHCAAVWKMTGL